MAPRNMLTSAPPFAVERAVRTLGANLKTARLRRNLSAAEMASRLGVDRHVIADAEKGKLTTGVSVYIGMLWALGLLEQLDPVADPALDSEGLTLARAGERQRARKGMGGMDNDF